MCNVDTLWPKNANHSCCFNQIISTEAYCPLDEYFSSAVIDFPMWYLFMAVGCTYL